MLKEGICSIHAKGIILMEGDCMSEYFENDVFDDSEGGEFDVPTSFDMPEMGASFELGRDADEKTARLFQSMEPHRQMLISILLHCDSPRLSDEIKELVEEQRSSHYCVYSSENLCDLLERSGALSRVFANGEPYQEAQDASKVVVEDGVEYLKSIDSEPYYWLATETGSAIAQSDDPMENFRCVLAENKSHVPVYKFVLGLCADSEGVSASDLDAAVDKHPLIQKPRFYAAHFIHRLEKAGLVAWSGSWKVTEAGVAGLEILADVEDEWAAGKKGEGE